MITSKNQLLTETAKSNEASNHQGGMQVELLLGDVISPGIALPVEEYPEYCEGGDADEQYGSERDDQRILAPLACASFMLVRVI